MDRLILTPAARREAILQLLRSARQTIILSMFRCDDFAVVDEVAAAVKRGVAVRVLITQRARGWRQKLIDLTALLESVGADVRPYKNSVMKYHAKYIVVDDGPALVTSLNFTRKCFESTRDFLIFSENQDIVAGLKTLFENDCNTSGSALPDITYRLIVGPDHARRRLTELLESAQKTIAVMDHRVTDPRILAILKEKQNKGVSVRIIGETGMDGLIAHGRMILIDQKTAIIGSIHLSPPSLDWRREVALVIEDTPIVTELYDYFENLARHETNIMNLWATGPAAPQEDEDDEEEE
ncbi:MAG TPA: phospholipase D-like domain-containing protein [Terriglobia bacterium]|nr:phospholipase D-like domain-containing protein [Terriglobia bacterium]